MMKSLMTLRNRLAMFRKEIAETHEKGKLPADYSLGMVNGLIFCEHIFSNKPGSPKFYNRVGAIGDLPKPVSLNSGNAIKDTQTHQNLMEQIVLLSRNLVCPLESDDETRLTNLPGKIEEIKKAFETLDNFISGEKEHGHKSRDDAESGDGEQPSEPISLQEMRDRTQNRES